MSDFNQYLDLSNYPPFSAPLSPPQDIRSPTGYLKDLSDYPFPTIGSTLDAATDTNAEDLTSNMEQHDASLMGSTTDTATDTNDQGLTSHTEQHDPSSTPDNAPNTNDSDFAAYLQQNDPSLMGSTSDTATVTNDTTSTTYPQQNDPSLMGSTPNTAPNTNDQDFAAYLQQNDPSLMGSITDTAPNTNPPDLTRYLMEHDPDLLNALYLEMGFSESSGPTSTSDFGFGSDSVWVQAQREAGLIQVTRFEEATRQAQAEAGPQTDMDMDMDTREGTNVEEDTGVDVDMFVDTNTDTGHIGFEPSFREFSQLLSPLSYGVAGAGAGAGSGSDFESTASSPLSQAPSTPGPASYQAPLTPPSSVDSLPSISGPSASHAPQASPRKGRASQASAPRLVTRAGLRLKPFGTDAANEMDHDRHRLWGQMSTVLIGKGYALKEAMRIPLDEMVQPAYVARNSEPLDTWHAGQNYYPVPSAPELALLKHARGSSSSAQLSQSGPRRGSPCFINFESVNQYGPGVALIEALNDRDVANSNSWPAFDFGGARSGEIVPFWPGYGEGQRIQIRRGMRYGEVARLIAQEFHVCWKRWGEKTVSPKEHLGFRIADSRHTRRTTAIDFSQVRLKCLFSLGGGEPYYAQLVVKIP